MDERESLYARMRSGEPYRAGPELLEDYARAQVISRRFNGTDDPAEGRAILEELTCHVIDGSTQVLPPFHIDFGKFTEFGKDVFVNFGCTFCDQGGIRIGDRTKLGPNVTLVTTNHLLEPEERRWMVSRPVVLGEDVWVGAGAIILSGVTVGDGAVVGAGSVVTKDVPPRTVVAGNPARVLHKI